jgi:hypothetical protein
VRRFKMLRPDWIAELVRMAHAAHDDDPEATITALTEARDALRSATHHLEQAMFDLGWTPEELTDDDLDAELAMMCCEYSGEVN